MGQTERRKVAVKKSLLLVQAGTDNKERESMSEKEKMKSEEIAKVLAENPTAKIYLAGLAQGDEAGKVYGAGGRTAHPGGQGGSQ